MDFQRRSASLPAATAPLLTVVVDTEEEFDWSRPFARAGHSVEALAELGRAQALFDRFGIVPVYAVDYPVADDPDAAAPLRRIVEAGRGVLGAQLHSWVTPPFDEAVTRANSYQGNLPAALERAKLERLTARIEETFGIRPVIHKAGRYGIGPATPTIIDGLGFEIDLSVCARFDGRRDGGPDHTAYSAEPFWFGPGGRLLELPSTAGYCGLLARLGNPLERLVAAPPLERARVKAAFSRLGLLERIRLSPEGYALADLKRLTRRLLADGVRAFSFSFHSPSLRPGCTPYVRNEADLNRLLETCRGYFEFFAAELGGRFATPFAVREALLTAPSRPGA
jgi:hypothetical protein